MSIKYVECEVWVCVDADGDYRVSSEGEAESIQAYADDVGGTVPLRTVRVVVRVPVPVVLECSVTAPQDAGEATATAE